MNNPIHHENLLRDILAEETPQEFRRNLREQTLRLAQRRRRFRQTRLVAMPCILALGFALLSWRWFSPNGLQSKPHGETYTQVRTELLQPSSIIESRALPPEAVVGSSVTVHLFTTAEAGYRANLIDDDALLELAEPRPAILIRRGPNESELMIAGLVVGQR